ncbi:MAG: MiaB/RimO family radical SAM methylthiotransferase [Actinomycetota bacterium]
MPTTFSAEFLGCKVSHTDLVGLRERLADAGYAEAADGTGQVHVVNGCCVTAEAVAKTRQAVRRALAEADHVLVTGCAARLDGAGLEGIDPRVRVVREAAEATPAAVLGTLAGLGCTGGERTGLAPLRRRMFLKVQDGCSFPCAYCVIPEVRGPTRSRPVGEVLAEAERRVRQGHREVVVTGVNVGLYRDRDAGLDLTGLLARLAGVVGLERVRLSSIEPNHLADDLLDVLARAPYLPHLHVPLQTGSDRLLRGMRRRYGAADYADRIRAARARMPEVAVTADVIAGLPGETEDDHRATLALVEGLGLARLHVFPYSPRPGTPTAHDDTDPAVKRRRAAELRALSDRLQRAHRTRHVGVLDAVLVEQAEADGAGRGQGRDGTPWRVVGAGAAVGRVVTARGTAILGDGRISGEVTA